jgi:alpha-L-arabinofuranosidase
MNPPAIDPWTALGGATILLDQQDPVSSALPNHIRVRAGSANGSVGIMNPGWWGMSIKQANQYNGSFYAWGNYSGDFVVSIVSDANNSVSYASVNVTSQLNGSGWVQHNYSFTPSQDAPSSNNSFQLQWFAQPQQEVKLNLISLFPPTYNNRPNGNRPELMQALKDLNPGYFRIPGGNNLEGQTPPYLWLFNNTIGPLVDRPGRPGTWGYQNTDGLGIIEYFNWAADLGADVVWAVWSGLYLDGTVTAQSDMQQYVDLALNELEFILGDSNSTWGSKRAAVGYPDPLPLKYVEIGNEDYLWGGEDSYEQYRLPMLYDAINAKYPQLQLFSTSVNATHKNSSVDFHEYTRPNQFVEQFNYFDNGVYNNTIMIGESVNPPHRGPLTFLN